MPSPSDNLIGHRPAFLSGLMSLLRRVRGTARLWVICLACACICQTGLAQTTGAHPEARVQRAARSRNRHRAARKMAPKPKPSAPKTPSEVAAAPAKVVLQNGSLTVDANNSDLSQILARVSSESGMEVDGGAGNARVFGAYGPGNPREVLTELLAGSGVNFVMMGNTAGGAPQQLMLTAEDGGAEPAAAHPAAGKSAQAGGDTAQAQSHQDEARAGDNGPGDHRAGNNPAGNNQAAGDQTGDSQGTPPTAPAAPQPAAAPLSPDQQYLQQMQQMQQQAEQQRQQQLNQIQRSTPPQ